MQVLLTLAANVNITYELQRQTTSVKILRFQDKNYVCIFVRGRWWQQHTVLDGVECFLHYCTGIVDARKKKAVRRLRSGKKVFGYHGIITVYILSFLS